MSESNSTQPVVVQHPDTPPIAIQRLETFMDRVQNSMLTIIRRYVQDEDKVEDLHSELTMLYVRALINPPPEPPAVQ